MQHQLRQPSLHPKEDSRARDEKSTLADRRSRIASSVRSGSRSLESPDTAIHQIRRFRLHEHIDPLSKLASESTSAHSRRPQRLTSVAIRRMRITTGPGQYFRKGIHTAWRSVLALASGPAPCFSAAFAATDSRLNMQGFSTGWFGIGILAVAACGSPSPLDEDAFPDIDQTGYTTASNTGGSAAVATAGSSGVTGSSAGTGGSAGSGTATGTGGSAPAGGSSGSAGSGDTASGGMGTTAGSGAGSGCPDDITTLFARPSAQGGCTNGGGCHEPGSPVKSDLVSPGVEARLLNVASSCSKTSTGASVQPRPYIGGDDSFLEEKIAGKPGCGSPMPFFAEAALSAADEQCIIDWIAQVSEGPG